MSLRAVSRCFTAASGALSVTTTGTSATLESFADSSDSLVEPYVHTVVPTLAVGLDRSGWTMSGASEMRQVWRIAGFEDGGYTTVATMKTLEWPVPLVISTKINY